ncbi:16S rRNA (cytidine(1402)-2'-O)-methyltransferase [Streptococcus sp. sy010]|uniref:16S rRNA (cytidine(1402)-2'-O)-methyltransferase n=1 Tax=Streptococcus sp. sy010 TaxID=2600148 RepID=UPI0011B7F740|nr:16S rRNA (cytidine(1402)-2'-O)-methyltransferase [Streptococcus sp. sy010]TWT14214.1 16S rRNA (cytidine(1402)-2'-O)-methyltransferase [Streptococcus sp. sy010]
MQIQKSFKEVRAVGSLYLVPTPIGNLQDMTFRAIDVLKSVDLICAEDTRTTGQLLKYFDIETPQTSFHEHNAYEKIEELIELLLSGKSLAQVSDAGMPSISDPGHDLVQAALAREIPVISLPGSSAGITALIASGIAPQPHIFYGFLPRKKGQQLSFFEAKKAYPETQIFYESPYRVLDTLTNMLAVYGDRQVVLVRELTKIYEEYQRASLSELIAALEGQTIKGECLIIVAGAVVEEKSIADQDPVVLVDELIALGHKPNQAIKAVAKEYGLNRQELYQAYHEKRKEEE